MLNNLIDKLSGNDLTLNQLAEHLEMNAIILNILT